MKPGIKGVGVCLRINTILSILLALTALGIIFYIPNIAENDPIGLTIMLAIIPTAMTVAGITEVLLWGLRRRRIWSWYGTLLIMIVLLIPPFLPLGIIGLWGLLRSETRRAFAGGY